VSCSAGKKVSAARSSPDRFREVRTEVTADDVVASQGRHDSVAPRADDRQYPASGNARGRRAGTDAHEYREAPGSNVTPRTDAEGRRDGAAAAGQHAAAHPLAGNRAAAPPRLARRNNGPQTARLLATDWREW
jgi:hypothetical protein